MQSKFLYILVFVLAFIAKAKSEAYTKTDNKEFYYVKTAEELIKKDLIASQKYLDSCLSQLETSPNQKVLFYAKLVKSQILTKQHRYEKAYSIANKTHGYFEAIGDEKALAKIHFIIGTYLSKNTLFSEALDEFWQSSNLFERTKDVENFVYARNSIGNCLFNLNRKDEAKTYFNFVKIYAEINKDSLMLYMSFKNLANAYDKQPEKAIVFYKNSISLGYKIEMYEELASLYLGLSKTFEELDNLDSAFFYLNKPLQSFNILRHKDKQRILIGLALLHSKSQNIDSATYYINQLKNFSDSFDDSRLEEDVYKLKSNLYSQQSNYKDAFFQLLEAYKINDSINKSAFSQSLNEIKEKYYYKQKAKQTEISKLEKENQVKQQEIKTLSFAIFSIFLVLLIIMGLFNASKQRKLNRSLNEKNEHINKSNIQLRNTINTRDRLISVIAHDIKNPLGAISGFGELLLMNWEKPEKVKQYASIIFKSATNLHALLENLLTWANSQTEQVVLKHTNINIFNLVQSTFNLLEAAAGEQSIRLKNNCNSEHSIFADSNTVQTIIRNITSNAIKFSNPKSSINILSEVNDKYVTIHIKDSGIGIKKEDIPKLFKQDMDREKIGVHKNKGTGVGLLLCKEFVELNKGSIDVQSEIGKGTTFSVHFPISKN
ncbi:MAG: HAMP domain-containing sensor histidine kinase [Salinivirgaceae bacterium]|jgi:signal transduction histidine kinase|nr:HAMP domain-containing sensor histidine kinase [Salinivirgaceae bacterium]